jgi:multiple sugar transport system substrate-binding protein
MRYRTVPVFPRVGDKINRAIERIATGRADAGAAMKEAQQQSIEDPAKAGVKLR